LCGRAELSRNSVSIFSRIYRAKGLAAKPPPRHLYRAEPQTQSRAPTTSAAPTLSTTTGLDGMSGGFLNLTRPVKQKRALLRSNPPRDNWVKAMKQTFAQGSPSGPPSLPEWRFVPELSPCLKNLSGRTAVRPGIERKPLTIVANSRPSPVQAPLNQCNES